MIQLPYMGPIIIRPPTVPQFDFGKIKLSNAEELKKYAESLGSP